MKSEAVVLKGGELTTTSGTNMNVPLRAVSPTFAAPALVTGVVHLPPGWTQHADDHVYSIFLL